MNDNDFHSRLYWVDFMRRTKLLILILALSGCNNDTPLSPPSPGPSTSPSPSSTNNNLSVLKSSSISTEFDGDNIYLKPTISCEKCVENKTEITWVLDTNNSNSFGDTLDGKKDVEVTSERVLLNVDNYSSKLQLKINLFNDKNEKSSFEVAFDRLQVDEIVGTDKAYAALKTDGSVVVWGDPKYGGVLNEPLNDVKSIIANDRSFVALKNDGSVFAWGDAQYGGILNTPLNHVKSVVANDSSYAALKNDGSVFVWGNQEKGGNNNSGYDLADIKDIFSNGNAFSAIKNDNSVISWGHTARGGDSSGVKYQLVNIQTIVSTGQAFSALRKDGVVISWGAPDWGGIQYEYGATSYHDNILTVNNVSQLSSTRSAFSCAYKKWFSYHVGVSIRWR